MLNIISFRQALFFSIILHIAIITLVAFGPKQKFKPINNTTSQHQEIRKFEQTKHADRIIEAVSINSDEVEAVVEKLKREREKAKTQRLKRIAIEKKAAQRAKNLRLAEEQRLAKLKREAIERKNQQRKEMQRLMAVKKERQKLINQKREEERKRRIAEERKIKLAKEAERRRAKELMEAKKAAQKQAYMNKVLQKYKVLIIQSISKKWILPPKTNAQLSCEFRIRLAPDGTVVFVRLSRSSGDVILDRSAEMAINKASPLPVPQERELFDLFRDIHLTVRPEQARG